MSKKSLKAVDVLETLMDPELSYSEREAAHRDTAFVIAFKALGLALDMVRSMPPELGPRDDSLPIRVSYQFQSWKALVRMAKLIIRADDVWVDSKKYAHEAIAFINTCAGSMRPKKRDA